jgi:hypothetical protein
LRGSGKTADAAGLNSYLRQEKGRCKMKFGAHLYGTATSNSDVDYKGIFMPSKEVKFAILLIG